MHAKRADIYKVSLTADEMAKLREEVAGVSLPSTTARSKRVRRPFREPED